MFYKYFLRNRLGKLKKKLVEDNDSSLYSKIPTFFTPNKGNELLPSSSSTQTSLFVSSLIFLFIILIVNILDFGTARLSEYALWIEFVALSDRTGFHSYYLFYYPLLILQKNFF
jgi:hypothetical protein